MQTIDHITALVATDWIADLRSFLAADYRKITHRQLSDKSIVLVLQHARVFSLWHQRLFGTAFEPANLTNYDLLAYRKWSLDQEKISAATWNSRHWALGILSLFIQERHGFSGLMDGVEQKAQKTRSTKHRSLTEDEYHRLVHVLEQNPRRTVTGFEYSTAIRDWSAVSLMLHAGLRVEEASLVDLGDITIGDRSGSVLVRHGKGDKEREVPLKLIARNAIRAWLEIRPASASQALFTGKESDRLTTRSLQRVVAALGAQIGVADLTPHWLRYTFAKLLEKNGTAIAVISELLGHNSVETTKRYLRSSMEDLQAAVEGVM